LSGYAKQDVLTGRVIRINPALITLSDGLIGTTPPQVLQEAVIEQVTALLGSKLFTFHVDVNFADYSGYPSQKPAINTAIFAPSFVRELNDLLRSQGCYLNLHLLSDHPLQHLESYAAAEPGAVCFQLDALATAEELQDLVQRIVGRGACASPVIETIGSERLTPQPPNAIIAQLEPVLKWIGMLTFQGAATASRSDQTAGALAVDALQTYIRSARAVFSGPIQLQGGIRLETVRAAVHLGAELLVIGTQLFHHPGGLSPTDVIDQLLQEASKALAEHNDKQDPTS
jgi:pentose-5-phosphate-3-epimerase